MNNERRKELKEIACFAYETVPLYSQLAEQNNFCIEDMPFEKLPIVDKSYYAVYLRYHRIPQGCYADAL